MSYNYTYEQFNFTFVLTYIEYYYYIKNLYFVSAITFTTVSVLGNSIILYVLSKYEFRRQSTFRYLFIGTIFNTINANYLWPIFIYNYYFYNEIFCRLFNYIIRVTHLCSSWINVINSIDTFCTVKYYSRFLFRKTFYFQIISFLLIFILSCFFAVPFYFFDFNQFSVCGPIYMSYIIDTCLDYYYMALFIVIPFIISITINYLTYTELVRQKKRVKQKDFKNAKNLFRLSLGLNLFFLLAQIPFFIVSTINVFNQFMEDLLYVSNNLIFFSQLISYIFYSMDIVVYFIVNKLFRKYCLDLFLCRKWLDRRALEKNSYQVQ